jgi:threonine dehydrogenase-like Zn-dependent dehydrogenase
MEYYLVTGKRKIEIIKEDLDRTKFAPTDIGGKTLFSLLSAGTEINGYFENWLNRKLPMRLGYNNVFTVDYVGSETAGFEIGDIVFGTGFHGSYQIIDYHKCLKLPEYMKDRPEQALFARMAGVSMATLSRTGIRPGDTVMVIGLGAVGLLAMQAYRNCGYNVFGVELDEERCRFAEKLTGLVAYKSFPEEWKGKVGLVLECSGTQQGILSACDMVREGGEISLVGIPWKKTCDVHSFEVLNQIFFKYIKMYSGWELSLPVNPERFQPSSRFGDYKLAMKWIHEGLLVTDGMATVYDYRNPQQIYEAVSERREKSISVMFDWRNAAI